MSNVGFKIQGASAKSVKATAKGICDVLAATAGRGDAVSITALETFQRSTSVSGQNFSHINISMLPDAEASP